MSTLVIAPLPGVGFARRLWCLLRGLVSRRALFALVGVPCVQIEGQAFAVRPVPLGVARDMVPALIRCAQSIAALELDEKLYDDFVVTMSLGLGVSKKRIEKMQVSFWQLAPAVELIARVNGFQATEAGRADPGKLMAAMTSTGTPSSPASSPTPAGPGSTSSNA